MSNNQIDYKSLETLIPVLDKEDKDRSKYLLRELIKELSKCAKRCNEIYNSYPPVVRSKAEETEGFALFYALITLNKKGKL